MLNRRALLRNSAAGAAVLLLPQATARAAAAARRALPPGRPVRRPDAERHHAAHGARRRRGQAAASRLEVARPTRRSARSSRARSIATSAAAGPLGQGARRPACKPHERYYYRFETQDDARAGRPLPDRAAGGLQRDGALRVLLVRGLHARLLQRLRADGARGRRLRRLPRRLHLRRELPHARGRDRRARRQDRQEELATTRGSCARR